jgi:hypothetical protein
VDALSEVLRVIRLDSAIFFNAEFSEPWCLASPESRVLAPALSPGAGHVNISPLLCEGRAYAELLDGERLPLVAGDLITFPHGHGHRLGGGASAPTIDSGSALHDVQTRGLGLFESGGGGARSHFICGFLACDPQIGRTHRPRRQSATFATVAASRESQRVSPLMTSPSWRRRCRCQSQ